MKVLVELQRSYRRNQTLWTNYFPILQVEQTMNSVKILSRIERCRDLSCHQNSLMQVDLYLDEAGKRVLETRESSLEANKYP